MAQISLSQTSCQRIADKEKSTKKKLMFFVKAFSALIHLCIDEMNRRNGQSALEKLGKKENAA